MTLVFDNLIEDRLKSVNKNAYDEGSYLCSINTTLGFDSNYLKLCKLFYFKRDEIEEIISKDVIDLYDKLEKLKYIENNKKKFKKEYVKVLYSKLDDFRIILAIFSDKINKITNYDENIVKIIEEVYLPLSHIIGIHYYTAQFEDYVIRKKYSKEYNLVIRKAKKSLIRDKDEIDDITNVLEKYRKHPDDKFYGRIKNPYSVFKKIYVRKQKLEDIRDFVAIRVITQNIEDCYSYMGHVFAHWEPMVGRIKDYIKNPKPNGYKSLHAVVITKSGPVEFQIRTQKMHDFAEYGVAAHWRYKGVEDFGVLDKIQKSLSSKGSSNKYNIGKEKVFVNTPKGDILILDKGASVLDFAYAIHTEIGNKTVRAIVGDEPVSLDYKLKDNDVVFIFTDKNKKPSRKSLEMVVTKKAKDKIKQYLGISQKQPKIKKENPQKLPSYLENASVGKCCKPFYDEDIGVYKTSKRKAVIHTIECLLKNNKSYIVPPKEIRNKLISKEGVANIDSSKLNEILEEIKKRIVFNNLFIHSSKTRIEFSVQVKSEEEWDTIKEKVLGIEGVNKVYLM